MKSKKLRPMTKLMVCLASILMASHALFAQDTTTIASDRIVYDTSQKKASDTLSHGADTAKKIDADTARKKADDSKLVVDKTEPTKVGSNEDWDTRWFISPLFKFQVQDFGMLEKNHFGYLSNANNLSLLDRSNISASLSAYKNITSHLSASADIGLAYGHVTSTDVLVASTTPKTYNLLNATVFYHLLSGHYKLQPFVSVGINDLIGDASYMSAPIGVGLKFHSNRIMVMGQAAYGYGVTKNIANTIMYNLCLYVPINHKKKKQDDLAANESKSKDDSTKNAKGVKNDKDSSSLKNGVVNNINITINMDSAMNAQRGKNGGGKGNNNGHNKNDDDFSDNPSDDQNSGNAGSQGLKAFNYQDFTVDDFEVDSVDGKAVVKFVIYFEFNQYDLNSSAFNRIDKVIARIRKDKTLQVDIRGFTDNVGTNEFNLFLSRKRAQVVFDYMNSRGIASEHMLSRFYGKENPVADNANPNTSWLNRRVEILIREKDTAVPEVKLPMPRNLRK
jgi:outer membrane protein OmpA-like peptidoglycan-associated protein